MPIIKKYHSQIISVTKHFDGITSLEIRPISGSYSFQPGQFLHLTMDSDYDGSSQWPISRCFSIQSNPYEKNIRITYSVKGEFTKNMFQFLTVGALIWLKLPYGNLFAQEHNKKNTIFIAGGTGVTPFLSLFTHNSFEEYIDPRVYLGFKTKNHNIYTTELNKIRNSNAKVNIVYQDSGNILNISKILRENGRNSCYFISGPPTMIKTFRNVLLEGDVSAHQILSDDWE